MFSDGIVAALSLTPPTACVLCGAPASRGPGLCAGCIADLPALGPHCRRCAVPLADAEPYCIRCRHRPPPYWRTFSPFVYHPPVDYLVHGLKFGQRLDHARLLGCLMAEHMAQQRCTDLPQLLLPVPLHPRRLSERGYNQALELARPAARGLGIALETRCCARGRATEAQTALDARQRRRNVAGAFTLVRSPAASHVAVIDDVMTTGSTVAELAAVLRRAGVERVDVWVCARAAPAP